MENCGHCGEKISRTLYYQHKKLYYSTATKTWKKRDDLVKWPDLEQYDEFTFSDTESGSMTIYEGTGVLCLLASIIYFVSYTQLAVYSTMYVHCLKH